MTELALFVSTFVVVFALGFQSLNVNGGHYWWAFFTSFAISGSNLVLFKLAPSATLGDCLAFMGGGPFGIVTSMWAHRRFVKESRPHWKRDPWEGDLARYLATRGAATTQELLLVAGVLPCHQTVADSNRLGDVMKFLGWKRVRQAYSSTWVWKPRVEVDK
jgi:hypothetical protein